MALVIIAIIAFWYLPLPLALQILMTVFGSLHCIAVILRAIVAAYKKQHEPQKTGIPTLDRFIK